MGADSEETDPVIERFVAFLARDLAQRPEAVTRLSPDLDAKLAALTAGIDIDLDAPIEGEVDH